MTGHVVKNIIYFDTSGAKNTDKVIEVVRDRIKEGDVEFIIIASITGETELKVGKALKDAKVPVICVSGPPFWQTFGEIDQRVKKHPYISIKTRKLLEELKVKTSTTFLHLLVTT